ncbi:MAG: ribosomal protein S18-alanine N-acetyltransferase [Sneathiella sp.]|uniref:ribosomal protein S18-alanine N-acetyltransferase n=1 Tax=Sneathiella sp. TaxID=1964365 RepID=UPI003002A257
MNIRGLNFEFTETSSHVELAAAMHQQCFSKPWDEASFHSAMNIPGTVLVLASEKSVPVAFLVYRYSEPEAEILTLGVLPAVRQRSIAGALLDQGRLYLQERDVDTLWLEVSSRNKAALCLYKSQGFKETGRRKGYYQDGGKKEDAIIMKQIFSTSNLRIDKRKT